MYFNIERCARYYGKMFCIGSGAEYDMRYYIIRMKENYFKKNIEDKLTTDPKCAATFKCNENKIAMSYSCRQVSSI